MVVERHREFSLSSPGLKRPRLSRDVIAVWMTRVWIGSDYRVERAAPQAIAGTMV
jgi:hypothetical protein